MRDAGMTARRTRSGTSWGAGPPAAAAAPAETLMLGSHLDTVRDAGRYDGMLGVLVALACVERRATASVRDRGRRVRRRGGRALRHRLPRQRRARRRASIPRGSSAATPTASRWPTRSRAFGGDPDAIAARRDATACSATSRSISSRGRCSRREDVPVGVVTGSRARRAPRSPSRAWPATRAPCRWRCAATRSPRPRSGSWRSRSPARGRGPGRDGRRGRGRPGASNVIPGRVG